MKKYIAMPVLAFLMIPGILMAQNFKYKAKLPPVRVAAFYEINVRPDIGGRSQGGLQDLRLFDNEGNEVPYLLKKDVATNDENRLIQYRCHSAVDDDKQVLTIYNPNKRTVSDFLFEMKNADASRLMRISGSDDKLQWFVVRDSFYFESYNDQQTATTKKSLSFPSGDYMFYKVEITTGDDESPLNILSVGNYTTNSHEGRFQLIDGLSYTIKDSNKTTIIRVKCQPGNRIDKLEFAINAPEMYHRSVTLQKDNPASAEAPDNYRPGGGKLRPYEDIDYANHELSSDKPQVIYCSEFLGSGKQAEFTMLILNQDNQPLQIGSIKGYQLAASVTAKLEPEKSYFLYFGDSLLPPPAYDIVYFQKNLPEHPQTLDALAIQPKATQDKDEYDGTKDKYIVWIGLGLAGVILFFLTMSMMKKMKAQS